MAVTQKRSRLVSFRLSDQEYEALQNFTLTEGARSLSDFARSALCDAMEFRPGHPGNAASARQSQDNSVHQTLERLIVTMEELNRVIGRLSVLVEANSAEEGVSQ